MQKSQELREKYSSDVVFLQHHRAVFTVLHDCSVNMHEKCLNVIRQTIIYFLKPFKVSLDQDPLQKGLTCGKPLPL